MKFPGNFLHFLRSHNQSTAGRGSEPTNVWLQVKVLAPHCCCLNKRAFKMVGLKTNPIPSQGIPLANWSKKWGWAYSLPPPHSPPLPRAIWAGPRRRHCGVCRNLRPADLQHSPEPCTLAAPIISEWGTAESICLTLLTDVRKAHCKHQISVCVYKSHYKHHREWEKNKASLFIA